MGLARRVAASDVGDDTLDRLELVVDDLATKYPVTPPAELLGRVRHHLAFVARLLDARTTLAEHGRLLVVGGWLSLLGATLHIDLKQPDAATARLRHRGDSGAARRTRRDPRLVLRDRGLACADRR